MVKRVKRVKRVQRVKRVWSPLKVVKGKEVRSHGVFSFGKEGIKFLYPVFDKDLFTMSLSFLKKKEFICQTKKTLFLMFLVSLPLCPLF